MSDPQAKKRRLLEANNPKVHLLPETSQIRAIMTIIRDINTSRQDFVFFSDRLMRLLIEEALSYTHFKRKVVTAPTGASYDGLEFVAKVCGVSIIRAGESMEMALRQVCRDVRVGKILIQREETTGQPDERYSYVKLPKDIHERIVFLLDPMLATGGSAIRATSVLCEKFKVPQEKIVFVNVVCCPEGIRNYHAAFPKVQIVTSAIDEGLNEKFYIMPGLGDFGDRYFGTES